MKVLGWLTVVSGAIVGLIGVLVLIAQVVVWLKYGSWSPLGINAFWGGGELQTDWTGFNKLAHTFRDFPIGMLILLGGIGVVHLGIKVVDYADRSTSWKT